MFIQSIFGCRHFFFLLLVRSFNTILCMLTWLLRTYIANESQTQVCECLILNIFSHFFCFCSSISVFCFSVTLWQIYWSTLWLNVLPFSSFGRYFQTFPTNWNAVCLVSTVQNEINKWETLEHWTLNRRIYFWNETTVNPNKKNRT